ncbi:MAG: hypothetical protein ACR2GO_02360, partial [Candidatus Limnocylindria bacterium]
MSFFLDALGSSSRHVVVRSHIESAEARVIAEVPGLAASHPARRSPAVDPLATDRADGVSIGGVVVIVVVMIV